MRQLRVLHTERHPAYNTTAASTTFRPTTMGIGEKRWPISQNRPQPVEKVLNKLIRKEDDTAFSSLRNSTNWQERRLSSKKGMNTWPKDTQKEAHLASDGNGCRPHPRFLSSRFRFCPEAITNASQLTLQSRRKRNRRIPCHSFASPNKGSTHTFRLRRAFWYASV